MIITQMQRARSSNARNDSRTSEMTVATVKTIHNCTQEPIDTDKPNDGRIVTLYEDIAIQASLTPKTLKDCFYV